MSVDVKVPPLGESVVVATVGRWLKAAGDTVEQGEVLVELETDKVNLEVSTPSAGVLQSIAHGEGDSVDVGDTLATIVDSTAVPGAKADAPSTEPSAVAPPEPTRPPTGPEARTPPLSAGAPVPQSPPVRGFNSEDRVEERVRMSRRRQVLAGNLLAAKRTTAMLTTFNKVDMSAVVALRRSRQEGFHERFGVRLGFMSFFTKAVVQALKAYPRVNSELQGETLIIKTRYDIAIAVGADEGPVVPVVRDADRKSFAEIEEEIAQLAD